MTTKIVPFYILALLLFFSCSTINSNNKKFYVKNFKKEFKQAAFCNCISYGYNDKNMTSRMTQIDKSFYNPVISSIFSEDLKEMAINEYNLIKKDSIASIENTSEANAGKKVIIHCLNFYNSKKLDSITSIQYEKWKKIKNIDSLMEVKNPVF